MIDKTKRNIEDQLNQSGQWLFQTVGDSMEPLLHNRESSVQIDSDTTLLKKSDVILYKRDDGTYVLHRICRIRDPYIYTRGDNRIETEKIRSDQVLGKMTGFFPEKTETFVSCDSPRYKRYLCFLPWRYCILQIMEMPVRARKLFRIVFYRGN